jgi:hypothetical protein
MEHRSATRTRALLSGQIRFNGGMSTMDCLVRDLSEGGARLQIGDSVAIPARFDLYIAKKDQTHRAALQWRTREEIGVAFEPATASEPADPDISWRVSQLEAETLHLRRLLDEMRGELQPMLADRSKRLR